MVTARCLDNRLRILFRGADADSGTRVIHMESKFQLGFELCLARQELTGSRGRERERESRVNTGLSDHRESAKLHESRGCDRDGLICL